MENRTAYRHLADWFEYLNDDCDYENWSQYLIMQLKSYQSAARCGLDIGCGGGWFTRFFAKQGYLMTGLDVSAQMLDYAQEQSLKQGVRGEYILGDVTKTKLPKRFDFAISINDCFNYIPREKLAAAFKNVAGALKKGGVFVFDVSSIRKFQEKIANTVSVDDRDEVTYLSFNKKEDEKVSMDVTLFVKSSDGSYQRLDERHVQYCHKEEDLVKALEENGFTLLKTEGHLGESKAASDRISFIARRN